MDEAQRDQDQERWLQEGRNEFHENLDDFMQEGRDTLYIFQHVIMLLALDPQLLASLPQRLQALPGSYQFYLDMCFQSAADDCPNPPTEEALEATATELAHVLSSNESFRHLHLRGTSDSLVSSVLATWSRLTSICLESCCLVTANVRATMSITTLQELLLVDSTFPNDESINEFCLGIETTRSLEILTIYSVSFSRERQEQVATALARCKPLVHFEYSASDELSPSFCHHYCAALSNNFDTKLEWPQMTLGRHELALDLGGEPCESDIAIGVDAAIVAKLRNLLESNVQRKIFPPLFAAIGNAKTDAARKQCLVRAFDAVHIPVVFEYITANHINLIATIQRLGRSRKRQRED